MADLSVGVVVISHNEGDRLTRTVEGLLATLPSDARVVVVDDHSTDGSVASLPHDERLTIRRPAVRLGVAGARNYGVLELGCDVLVFSDAHVDVSSDWWDPLVSALADPAVGAVAPSVVAMGEPSWKGWGMTWSDAALNVEWLPYPGDAPVGVPMLCGCFLAMRREVFERCGGFDDGLFRWGAEDLELSLRLWTLGYQCLVVPEVEVAHLFRERFPYEISPQSVLANLVRVAIVHLTGPRLAAVVSCLRLQEHFPAAVADVLDGDASQRAIQVRSQRVHDDAWYIDRFAIRFDRP